MTPSEVRSRMIKSGFDPLPVSGKAPVLKEWQKRTETSQGDLEIWNRLYPDATNTGMLCTRCPTLDVDILDETAVNAAIALVRERFGERGKVMLRYGRRPKVAIPFRTDTPFDKVQILLTAPDGDTNQKIELLCRGQQVVVHGIHPDTHEMYQWSDGNPGNTKRAELPPINEVEAQALVEKIADLLVSNYGYQRAERKGDGGGAHAGNGTDNWGDLPANILAGHGLHRSLRDLAAKSVAAGMAPGAVVNFLRGLMDRSAAPHDKRWQDRYDNIPRLVTSAQRLPRENEEREPAPPCGADPPEKVHLDPVHVADGAAVLDDVYGHLGRFVRYPSDDARIAHTLWCAHTHMMSAWESTPRIAFLSAEPESGKTRGLEASEALLSNPISTVNASASYLFRKAGDNENGPVTVLFDEIDTIFGPKAKEHEDIRGFINAGHRRGATYGRCVVRGSTVSTEETPVYAAVAMAGLGWLPDTLLSRSIIIRMRRRLRTESVEPFRQRIHVPQGQVIGRRLAAWAKSVIKLAAERQPDMPEGVEDRQADAWEPLLVVADLAGGEWPRRAREAAVALVGVARATPVNLHLRLLEDLRTVFWRNLTAVTHSTPKGLPTKKILEDLYTLDDAPWHVINKGEAFSSSQLAANLFNYGVEPTILRPHSADHSIKARGYRLNELADAWRRYLKPLSVARKDVASVAREARETLDQFFEWQPEPSDTPATPATSDSGTERGAGLKALDPNRVNQLAKWWRKRMRQLLAELGPVLAEEQAQKELRDTLAEELVESALGAEIGRVVEAANKPKSKRAES